MVVNPDASSCSVSLSPGAIAGIAISVVAVGALIAMLVYLLVRWARIQKSRAIQSAQKAREISMLQSTMSQLRAGPSFDAERSSSPDNDAYFSSTVVTATKEDRKGSAASLLAFHASTDDPTVML